MLTTAHECFFAMQCISVPAAFNEKTYGNAPVWTFSYWRFVRPKTYGDVFVCSIIKQNNTPPGHRPTAEAMPSAQEPFTAFLNRTNHKPCFQNHYS